MDPLFDEFRSIVARRFVIEGELFEFDTPIFYVAETSDLKDRFLGLLRDLEPINYLASMRRSNGGIVIQIFKKPPTKTGNKRIITLLFFSTLLTTFIAGFLQSAIFGNPYLNAALFTAAIMAILGLHEMGHKIAIKKYHLEASGPYFIPGPPPLGTFGALIRLRSMIPNRDALFDMGMMGPTIGFAVSIIVTIAGLSLSDMRWVKEVPPHVLSLPFLYRYLVILLLKKPPNPHNLPHLLVILHPVAFAGYIGILITMLNLIPAGQLDGGHIAYCMLKPMGRRLLSFIAIGYLFLTGYWFFALFALFTMAQRHPEPLDSVSDVSLSRKIAVSLVIAIFVLSLTPIQMI